ncbi:MAG: D-isomer specific 2-hydroxyacid dehydrogenase family protein [Actinomycetota bacterium]|nr:D-isomer specific 2-hydroxyacid dehydrogenase family protein [Actinomycetota bacterium]
MGAPRIAVLGEKSPAGDPPGDELFDAVRRGGGAIAGADEADGVVWVDPTDPGGLVRALEDSSARWVQLPFAGIEPFVSAGVIDEGHLWTCAKGIYGESCAEHALAFMLVAWHRMHDHIGATRWLPEDSSSTERRFHGQARVAIVGTGGIGGSLASMLEPFDAHVIGVNRSGRPLAGAQRTIVVEELSEVVSEVDFVVLAAATTPETEGLFDEAMLASMRSDAWLINVARGALVDTDALVDALQSGVIGGAALDVTAPEPLPEGHPLWELENCIITPHIANTWVMGLPALCGLVERNVAHFGAGEPLEAAVDPKLGY